MLRLQEGWWLNNAIMPEVGCSGHWLAMGRRCDCCAFTMRAVGLQCIAGGGLTFHPAWRSPQYNCLVVPTVLQSRLLQMFLRSSMRWYQTWRPIWSDVLLSSATAWVQSSRSKSRMNFAAAGCHCRAT